MGSSMFHRTELLIGKESIELLKSKKVIVFGVGGVGGFVIEALARTGVGTIAICDMDTVNETNINRQVIALHSTIGKYKTEVMKERLLDINPFINVETYNFAFNEETQDLIEFEKYDYIVDAIDMVSSKILLIRLAKEKNIPIISSMGTGNKLDPSKFVITDLSKTNTCPLAKKMRYELKKYDIKHCKVLFSTEPPTFNEFGIVASIAFVPSSAGLLIAKEVVMDILTK